MDIYAAGSIIYRNFNTHKADGTPITLAGTPAARVYKDDGTTEDDSGITLTVDFDSKTGLHNVKIDTSQDATFYATGHDFSVVLSAGTVDSVSVVGYEVFKFRLGEIPVDIVGGGAAPTVEQIRAEMDSNSTKLANLDMAISAIPTAAEINTELEGEHGAGAWGAATVGATAKTYTVTDGAVPIEACEVWATSDLAGATEIANRGLTNDLGQHIFYFDVPEGTTVYIWRRKSGYTFTNPDTEVV